MTETALLALEDGTLFYGTAIGARGKAVGEVVFNTAITGYQEILTDPSYYKQIITLTHPHIGNTGINNDDQESNKIFASALVIRDLPIAVSSWRAQEDLSSYLKKQEIVAIADIDTRQLTHHLRRHGSMKGCVATGNIEPNEVIAAAQSFAGLIGMDLAKAVSTTVTYPYSDHCWTLTNNPPPTHQKKWQVIAYDFGVKRNILRILTDLGCAVTVVPATTTAAMILAKKPDGVFLSNGPGDPEPCAYAIHAISELIDTGLPLFGICLGYQLLSLALGAKTVKMKFGHHGANHPVQTLNNGQVLITSQNHSFAVDEQTLPKCLLATHRSLFDHSLQGVHHQTKPVFGFQGHPEASPGPHDLKSLFNEFIQLMQEHKNQAHA